MSVHARIRDVADDLTWLQRSLLVGLVLSILWSSWSVPPTDLSARVVRDVVLFLAIPSALAIVHGRRLGYTVDRTALRDTLLLSDPAHFVRPGEPCSDPRERLSLEGCLLAQFDDGPIFVLVSVCHTTELPTPQNNPFGTPGATTTPGCPTPV